MRTYRIISLVLFTNAIVSSGPAQTIETNSALITGTNSALLDTWATISNHWAAISPSQIKQAADQGDASAQFYLGMSYFDGTQLVQDQEEAIKWIKSAADKGLPAAEHNLGWRYSTGNGLERDYGQAMAWCQKAADQGFAKGEMTLGWLYAEGDPEKRDYALAEQWMRKAADQGTAEAQYQFGMLMTHEFDKSGHQIANFQEAAEWYRKAADQGYAKAQYELAELYHTGKLGDDKRPECIPWFQKAAAQGEPRAQAVLGDLRRYYPNSELLKDPDASGSAPTNDATGGRTQ